MFSDVYINVCGVEIIIIILSATTTKVYGHIFAREMLLRY